MSRISLPLIVTVLTGALFAEVSAEMCAWCENGDAQCDWSYSDFTQGLFTTSVSSDAGGRKFPYHHPSNQKPFEADDKNAAYTLAVIVQHGAGRNGQDYCSYMTNSVLRSGGSLDSTLVVAPQIYEPGDEGLNESDMLWWSESTDDGIDSDGGAHDWKWGGNSTADLPVGISTFSVYDEMVTKLADRSLYPNIRRIVLAGHSAGGQVMQRYALFSLIGAGGAESSVVPSDTRISYYVANPSSVTYLGAERPVSTSVDERDCDFCVNSTIESQLWQFRIPKADDSSAAASCVYTYNTYGYGLEGNMPIYPTAVSPDAALKQYPLRDVTYLSGSSDICDYPFQTANNCTTCDPDDGGLDTSCEAYSQGWCRMARLHAFAQYVNKVVYKRHVHNLIAVPNIGHSGCGMFQSSEFVEDALIIR